jgi:preprotein translocase subunit SecF
VDIVRHRNWYVGVSLAALLPGLVFMGLSMWQYPNHAPLRLGIDFTGGTLLQYRAEAPLAQTQLAQARQTLEQLGYAHPVVQITSQQGGANQHSASVLSIRTKPLAAGAAPQLEAALERRLGTSLTLTQKNAIGPTLANELLTHGLLALVLAYTFIVGYLSFRFKLDYALCAIAALLHDSLFVVGVFSALGYLFHTEVDSLFITGILTVVGFSVHDTIVVFDRIRENAKIYFTKKLPFGDIANLSVNQTLTRSINTSVTAVLTLLALWLLGGDTTRDFVFTMLLGIIVGTYSSIFVASATLVWWRQRTQPSQHTLQPASPAEPQAAAV